MNVVGPGRVLDVEGGLRRRRREGGKSTRDFGFRNTATTAVQNMKVVRKSYW